MGRRVASVPEKGSGMFYVGMRAVKVGAEMRQPGDAIPEAFDWTARNIQAGLNLRRLVYVPFSCAEKDLKAIMGAIPPKTLPTLCKTLGIGGKGSAADLRARLVEHLRGGKPSEDLTRSPPKVVSNVNKPVPPPPPKVQPKVETTEADSGTPRKQLESMPHSELIQQASLLGVDTTRLSRGDLINAILVEAGYEVSADGSP